MFEGDVDGIGNNRARRAVDLGKFDPLDVEALAFRKLHLLHHRTKPQAEATGPVADLYFLRQQLAGNG